MIQPPMAFVMLIEELRRFSSHFGIIRADFSLEVCIRLSIPDYVTDRNVWTNSAKRFFHLDGVRYLRMPSLERKYRK